MSKSLGNVVNPLDLIAQYGVDALRYYLMSEMILGQDSNFTLDNFIKRYNSDLANDFGNLLNRVSGLLGKYFDRIVPEPGAMTPAETEIVAMGSSLGKRVEALIADYKVDTAINEVMNLVRAVNKYMEAQAPWKLCKDNPPAAARVLFVSTEALRLSAVLLKAVMPTKANEVLTILGATTTGLSWGELKPGTLLSVHPPLFPRIELDKK
jgi:methionyl-tRNA synthetase